MCLAMYLFTNSSLPESTWSEADPKIWLQRVELQADKAVLRWPHDQSHAYYVGGYEGCGCGWRAISYCDEPEEIVLKKKDRESLLLLLKELDLESTWLVVCWEGDQGEPLDDVELISMANISDAEFEFQELRRYEIA